MITTDINWPDGLPYPTKEGYVTRHANTLMRTQMQSGRARQRRAFASVPSMVSVSWVFNSATEAAAFELWWHSAIKDGAEWFNCPLVTPVGDKPYVCRFTQMYDGPNQFGSCGWRVTAQLEVFDRPLFPPEWGDMVNWLAMADIFDIAMNAKWPEAQP